MSGDNSSSRHSSSSSGSVVGGSGNRDDNLDRVRDSDFRSLLDNTYESLPSYHSAESVAYRILATEAEPSVVLTADGQPEVVNASLDRLSCVTTQCSIMRCGQYDRGMFAHSSISQGQLLDLELGLASSGSCHGAAAALGLTVQPLFQARLRSLILQVFSTVRGVPARPSMSSIDVRLAAQYCEALLAYRARGLVQLGYVAGEDSSALRGRLLRCCELVQSRAMTLHDLPGAPLVLFNYLSNYNHSCVPNAELRATNGPSGPRGSIFALTNIAAGSEVTISYLPPVLTHRVTRAVLGNDEDRQKRLFERWGFMCQCAQCMLPG